MSNDESPSDPPRQHADEPHAEGGLAGRLNWLRTGVLGANDGIVSVAAIVVGVAGATPAAAPVLTAGVAALVGGVLPLAAILLSPQQWRVPATFAVVLLALAFTGVLVAKLGGSRPVRATVRIVVVGALALAATFAIGSLLGTGGAG